MKHRIRRVNEAIKEVLAELLADLKDPRIGFVTITDVRTAPDLRVSEVFFTVLPDDEESLAETAAGLRSATPLLRRQLGARVRLKYVPDLRFSHDPLPDHSRRIEELLGERRPDDHPEPQTRVASDDQQRRG